MSNAGSGFTHRKGVGETTEWDDILRKKGIIPEDPAAVERAAAAAVIAMAEDAKERIDPLAHKTVAELDALEEDDADFGDSRAVDAYRAARIAELKAKAARARFGDVRPLARLDFVREVNDASADGTWVIVHLHQEYVDDSRRLERVLAAFARAQPAVKCLAAKADACVENYPDKNVPTLLLYRNGELQSQLVGLGELGGERVNESSAWRRARAQRAPRTQHSRAHARAQRTQHAHPLAPPLFQSSSTC